MTRSERDHPYLPVNQPAYASRTFMGSLQMQTRSGLFAIFCVLAMLGFVLLAVHVDQRTSQALLAQEQAASLSNAVTETLRSQAELRALEYRYLQTRDSAVADSIRLAEDRMSISLDQLLAHPDADELEQALTTLKDGLAQYEGHVATITARAGVNQLQRVINDINEALRPRLTEARPSAGLIAGLTRLNQAGSEIFLNDGSGAVAELQAEYRDLAATLAQVRLPNADKAAVIDLLQRHEQAMLGLLADRLARTSDAQRFEDIQLYIEPSLVALEQVSAELMSERMAAVAEARRYAGFTLAGGGAAILLWALIAGLILMRSITRPVQALAGAASGLMRGNRTVLIPGRGNVDAVGYLARAFDDWVGALNDAEDLRQDLEEAQARMEQSVMEAQRQAALARETTLQNQDLSTALEAAKAQADEAAAARANLDQERDALRQAIVNTRGREQAMKDAQAAQAKKIAELEAMIAHHETVARERAEEAALLAKAPPPARPSAGPSSGAPGEMPLQALSAQLAALSSSASTAATDVERTEALARALSQISEDVTKISSYVVALRDQFAMFVYVGQPPAGVLDEDRVTLRLDPQKLPQAIDLRKGQARQRLALIRDAMGRSLATLGNLQRDVTQVQVLARTLASSASNEAKTATDQLLGQSAKLQHMLNKVISEMAPAGPPDSH